MSEPSKTPNKVKKKVKKTKEERKAARQHFWWRMSLSVKGEKAIREELDQAIEDENTKKLVVLLPYVRILGADSYYREKEALLYVWKKAAEQNKNKILGFLYNYKEVDGRNRYQKPDDPNADKKRAEYFLTYAVVYSNYDLTRALLEQGVKPNYECDGYYMGPNLSGIVPLHKALMNRDEEMARLLLKNDADVNYGSAACIPVNYITSICPEGPEEQQKFYAGVKLAHKCLDLLLEYNPDLNFRQGELLAVVAKAKDTVLFEQLLENGADVNIAARSAAGQVETLAFMRPYVERTQTGWHLMDDDNMVMKVSYATDTDTRMREIFNLASETKTVQVGDAAPTELSFNQASQKQVANAKTQQAKLLKKKLG